MARQTRRVIPKPVIPKLIPVTSSNIVAMGHVGNKMYVQYKNESIYLFDNVTKQEYIDLVNNGSIGKALFATGWKGTPVVQQK